MAPMKTLHIKPAKTNAERNKKQLNKTENAAHRYSNIQRYLLTAKPTS